MMPRVALVLVALAAGCFERGRDRPPRGDDGGTALPAVASPTAEAIPSALQARAPTGRLDPDATVTIALTTEPASLDPVLAGDAATLGLLMGDVFEGLVGAGDGPAAPPVPALASRWTVSPDGRLWTFWLRDARWHDGAPVTAADVIFTIELLRVVRGRLASEVAELVEPSSPGPGVVTLRFARPRLGRLEGLATIPIVPRHRLGAVLAAADPTAALAARTELPVGSGPLRVTAWRRGDALELARVADHPTPAAAARVIYRICADRAHALRLIAAGDADVVLQVPLDDAVGFAAAHADAAVFRYALPAYLAAVYRVSHPGLQTPAQRRALTALLDRATIARVVLGGAPTITGPLPPGDPGVDPAVAPVPFDRAVARQLLGAERPRLTVLVPAESRTMARIADIWAADARGLATLEVTAVPFADLVARLRTGDFAIALTSFTTGPELDLWPQLSSRSRDGDNYAGLADAELDGLLDQIRDELDPARRLERVRALHRRLDAVQPYAFIAADVRVGVARRAIGGVASGPGAGVPPARRLGKAR